MKNLYCLAIIIMICVAGCASGNGYVTVTPSAGPTHTATPTLTLLPTATPLRPMAVNPVKGRAVWYTPAPTNTPAASEPKAGEATGAPSTTFFPTDAAALNYDCTIDSVPPYQPPAGIIHPSVAIPKNSSLRALAELNGMYVGTATAPGWLAMPEYLGLLTSEFNMVAVENAMKWEVLHPEPDRYDFTEGDQIVAIAEANGLPVYGHVLAWGLQNPEWVENGNYTREEWINILCTHIKTVVGHYRGHIYAWDVVNEALAGDGTLGDNIWMRNIGPEYIPLAFRWAYEADPQALLIYNDVYAEGLNAKSEAVYKIAKELRTTGIPLHGIGMQMHVLIDKPPDPGEVLANMQRISELGLQAHITEMDVRTYPSDAPMVEKLEIEAQIYRQMFGVCLQAANCNVFITWGLADNYSWIPGTFGHPDAPLLFDDHGQPKPAYWTLIDLLSGR